MTDLFATIQPVDFAALLRPLAKEAATAPAEPAPTMM